MLRQQRTIGGTGKAAIVLAMAAAALFVVGVSLVTILKEQARRLLLLT